MDREGRERRRFTRLTQIIRCLSPLSLILVSFSFLVHLTVVLASDYLIPPSFPSKLILIANRISPMGLTFHLILAISSIALATAQPPTCPNGQASKVDASGRPIQCLPGSSQNVICGNDHACFFTGMNYVCCPSNEPTEETELSCNSPYLTVLGSDGLALKCSPRTRTCPRPSQFCSDVGLAYICCERSIGRDPPKEVDPIPRSEDTLECPKHAIGVLNERGGRVVCNSRKRCPGKHQFCYGGLKRSICCEHYDTAKNMFEDKPLPKKERQAEDSSLRIAPRLRQVSLSSRELLGTTTTERTIIRSDTFVSNMLRPRSSAVATAIRRRTGPREVEKLDLSGVIRRRASKEFGDDPESITAKIVTLIGGGYKNRSDRSEEADEMETTSTRRTRRPTRIEDTTEEEEGTTEAMITDSEWLVNDGDGEDELLDRTITRTTESYEPTTTEREYYRDLDPFRRARMHAAKTQTDQEKPISIGTSTQVSKENDGFALGKPLDIPKDDDKVEDEKKEIAEKFIMQQIRDGWPYAEKFYRPDAE